ncbi:MAG: right-handed parallel beta-helix repeat-containing protein [Planctomycetota bacterium]|nr:right-handed parallel beta-helix repeat-containing protein [Planctomycetota bacterium]
MSNIRDFGAVGDGRTDDTSAIQHAIDSGDGVVEFPRGDFRITRTLLADTSRFSRLSLDGSGGTAKLRMAGPGPAIFLKATHAKTADPNGFRAVEWQHERMPTVRNIEIEGGHPEADGIRIEGVMQPTLTGVLIRQVRHGIHITNRARNVLISHCHIYENKGIGVYLDHVNLHQTIITGSHISYCRLGGIRIEDSEIRNLQITGNDIEYNNNRAHNVPDADDIPTAEIYIDVGKSGSVREGTISSNTLQATYSPNGSNVRIIGRSPEENHKAGMWAISGNLIGSQWNNIHLTSVRGVTISGNFIYSGHNRNLLVEQSRNIVVGPNAFGHNPDYRKNELCTGIRFVDSTNCNLTGVLIEDCQAGRHTVPEAGPQSREGLLELVGCRGMNLSGVQVLEGAPSGIRVKDCSDTLLSGCTVLDQRDTKLMQSAIHWTGAGTGNMITGSRIGKGTQAAINAPDHVMLANNLVE